MTALWNPWNTYSIKREKADGLVFNPIGVTVHTNFPLPGTVKAV